METVDVEVRITLMQGTYMFRRDRTCQLIKCNPWSTRLCPHPTIIMPMKTYLELEGKLEPKPQSQTKQFRLPLPDTNPQIRKEPKMAEKRKRLSPTKKLKSAARSNPSNTMAPGKCPSEPKESATPNLRK